MTTASPAGVPTGRGPALLFLLAALVLRASTFGNPNLFADDAFYVLIGQRIHDGVLPYVDVWDRKPPGLFAVYWAIAGISRRVIAYQLAATLSAALTALVICMLVSGWSNGRGGALAGLAYLLMLGPLDGYSGQAPVFYNLPMVLAAWLVWTGTTRCDERRLWLAMALCGVALSIKQTTLFESVFLGSWSLWGLRSRLRLLALAGRAAGFGVLGLAPMLGFAAAYWSLGQFGAFWQAMVTSNLIKAPLLPGELRHGAASMAVRLAIPLALALWGLLRGEGGAIAGLRSFLVGWLIAGLAGMVAVPHFFPHYALPLLVPLSAAAGLILARASGGALGFALVVINAFTWYDPFDRGSNLQAIAASRALASAVVQHDHGRGLFVYDGPLLLYAMTGRPLPGPLVFPHHLNQAIERNVSQFDTDAEVDRVLARHPGAVVSVTSPRNFPVNTHTWNAVQAYVLDNCRQVALVPTYEHLITTPIAVYGDCQAAAPVPQRPLPLNGSPE